MKFAPPYVRMIDFYSSVTLISSLSLGHLHLQQDTAFSFFEPHTQSARCAQLIDGLHLNALYQLNNNKNYLNRTLDLIYANWPAASASSSIRTSDTPLLPVNHHHPPLEFNLNIDTPTAQLPSNVAERWLDFSRINLPKLESLISLYDESFDCSNFLTLDHAVDDFSEFMRMALNECVPVKKLHRGPAWGDRTLRTSKRAKRAAYRNSRDRRCPALRVYYNSVHAVYRRYNRICHRRYLRNIEKKLRVHPQHFWTYANNKRKSSGFPGLICYNGNRARTLPDMCELFATRFEDTFVSENMHPEALHAALTNTPADALRPMLPFINTSSVTRAKDRLKMTYKAGPDGIPAVILKKCTASIAPLLVKIFEESLRSCTFPVSWKVSWLTSIHKKGCKNEASNYRGITSLGAIAKVL